MSKSLLDYIGLEVVLTHPYNNDGDPYLAFSRTHTKVYRVDAKLLQWEHMNEDETEEFGLGEGDILLGTNVSLYFLALTMKGV